MKLEIEITYTPKGDAVCKNASGMTFFLCGEPPRPAQGSSKDEAR